MALRKLWDRWQPMDGAPRAARVLLACVALSSAAGLVSAPSALGETKRVTFAARVCDSYANVFANEARNNIMESLKQLGPNTPYSSTAQMDPITEDLPPQGPAARPAVPAHCAPLVGWRFTMGTAGDGDKVSGDFGRLSTVACPGEPSCADNQFTDPGRDRGQRADAQRRRGWSPRAGATVKGAVTINLSQRRVGPRVENSLWVMGGTRPRRPSATAKTYAFAALRCATDNLNGDNVEFVSMPTGVEHVYCFAYYVSPPKGSGTIIVRRRSTASRRPRAQTVNFKGNISFANNDPVRPPRRRARSRSLTAAAPARRRGGDPVRPRGRVLLELQGDPERQLAPDFDAASCTSPVIRRPAKSPITIPDPNADAPARRRVASSTETS